MVEYLSGGIFASLNDRTGLDAKQRLEVNRSIHARWLMTAREDLDGRTPREMLLADRARLDVDLEHRAYQWQMQGRPALSIAEESAAYRFAGFGTIQVVIYFELIRMLLDTAWKLIDLQPSLSRNDLVARLSSERDRWLKQPYDDLGMSAAELIDSERRRVPITSNGSLFDCDCPICRAEADGLLGLAPAFLWFDGSQLEIEDDFAFSLTESYADWKRERDSCRTSAERPSADSSSAGDQLALENDELQDDSVWQSSYVNWDAVTAPDSPPGQALFSLAFPLAEIITDLKQRDEGRDFIQSLNSAYDMLRRTQDSESARVAASRFCAILEQVCRKFPDLTPKCADLQSHVDAVMRCSA